MRAALFVLVGLLLASAKPVPTAQPRPSLFGIALGAHLDGMPECPHPNGLVAGVSVDLVKVICWHNPRARSVPSDGTVYIVFPFAQTPSFVAREGVSITLRGGVVEKIVVNTKGLSVQDELLRMLMAKFGRPSSNAPRTVQTAIGGHLTIIEAEWLRPLNDHLIFAGAYNTVDTGAIVAITDHAWQQQKAYDAAHAGPAL
jgi:hypothetical protein